MFVTADLVALSVQGVGGALAATAAGNNKDPEKGGKIMLGGIVFQILAITIYMGLAIEFVYRFWYNEQFKLQGPSRRSPNWSLHVGPQHEADVSGIYAQFSYDMRQLRLPSLI